MTPPRYCFVAGLHRSGTSLLARLLGHHPDIASLQCPHVPENEGAYLQGAIPHTARHGIPGAFAFDGDQHLTEASALNTGATAQRIARDWAPWFADGPTWRLEKSPVNLLRMRLYQQLFPMAHFIVITRHPAAVAQATAKWSDATPARLVDHWSRAHAIALHDMSYLHCALLIRYEDLVARPSPVLAAAQAFLDLPPCDGRAGDIRDGNRDYAPLPGVALPDAARRLGYAADSLAPAAALPPDIALRHPLRRTREAVSAARDTLHEDLADG